ncbi:hypothetical protein [Epilithonimonas sp. UC225_85]|uniref:hypothetical protein n=1 Tax=Epilithonimonas sp. UC225_85 TaxID=3350167 RepID=UPI0036D28700
MSDRIKLLELDIDFDNVIKRAADARNNMESLKASTSDMKKVLDEVNARYKDSETELRKLESQGKKNTVEYETQKRVSEALRVSVEKKNVAYESEQSKLREAQKAYRVSKTVLDAFNESLKDGLNIIVETDGSIDQLNAALANNREVYRGLNEEQRNNVEIGGRLLELIQEQDRQYKALNIDMGVTQVNVGNYTKGITEAIEKLKAGDLQGFTEDVKDLGTKWIETSKGIWKSISTMPVVGWIAAVAVGIGLAINEVYKYNKELSEANKLTESITNLQGDALDRATLKAKTLEEALGLDKTDTLEAARALVNEFGITYEEALQRIEDGAIKGGAANEEYLDSIKEYPAFFAKAGFSATEFIDIINAGADVGIFKDKLPDAIKEFGLAITEQTKTARSALVNAFGAQFTDDLLKRVSDGKTTIKDSLIEISKESDKYSLSQKQQAQLTADLFKGAGEDAGGFVKVMEAVNNSLINQNSELTETQKFTKKVVDQMNELEDAKLRAMKSDSILAFKKELDLLWLKIQTVYYNAIAALRVSDREFNASAAYMRGVFKSLPEAAITCFEGILKAMDRMIDGFKSGGGAISKFFKGDFDGAMDEAIKFKNTLPKAFDEIKKSTSKAWKDVGDAGLKEANDFRKKYDAQQKVLADAARKEQEEAAKKPTNNFDGSEDKAKADEAARKKAEDEAKKHAQELLKISQANAKAKIDIMKSELDAYILNNKSRIEEQTFVTNKLLQLENDRLDIIHKKKLEQLEAEKKLELSNKDLTELQKQAIEQKFSVESLKLTDETAKAKKDLELKYAEQLKQNKEFKQLVEHQQKLLDIKKYGNDEFAVQQENLDYEYMANQERKDVQKEIDQLAKQEQDEETVANKIILEQRLNQIDTEYAQASIDIAQAKEQAKLLMAGSVAGNIAEIVGKQTALGKAAAIAETSINTYAAATAAYKSLAAIPIVGPALGAVAAGFAVAAGLANVGRIVGVKVPDGAATGLSGLSNLTVSATKSLGTPKKAEKGILLKGNTHARGGANLYDDYGNHVVNYEGDELLAVINKKSTGMLRNLSFINQLGGGIPLTHNVKHAASGGMISSSSAAKITNQVNVDITDQIGPTIAAAAFSGIQEGMRGLSDDRNVMNDAKI